MSDTPPPVPFPLLPSLKLGPDPQHPTPGPSPGRPPHLQMGLHLSFTGTRDQLWETTKTAQAVGSQGSHFGWESETEPPSEPVGQRFMRPPAPTALPLLPAALRRSARSPPPVLTPLVSRLMPGLLTEPHVAPSPGGNSLRCIFSLHAHCPALLSTSAHGF